MELTPDLTCQESCGPVDVEAALSIKMVSFRMIQAAAARATQAAQSLGVDVGAVVKSLVFLADGQPVLVLVGGDRRVDTRRLKQILGARKVRIASPEKVREATGYSPGAVPPVGHVRPLPIWIDAALGNHATVYVSGGAVDMMVALAFEDLLKTTAGQVTDISAE